MSTTPLAEEISEKVERLFAEFITPMILGGELRLGKPIGSRAAVQLGPRGSVIDVHRTAPVQLARVRDARQLFPIDRVNEISADEWTMLACLHDLLLAQHPSYRNVIFQHVPAKLISMALEALQAVAPAANLSEALSRHTLFSRMFEIARTDTKVSWWTGSETFYGTDPTKRLLLWPSVRRVKVERIRTPLSTVIDADALGRTSEALEIFLRLTPLTNLLTATRLQPHFEWSPSTLGLIATREGRSMVLRGLQGSLAEYDVFGRAVRVPLASGNLQALRVILDLLGEMVLRSSLEGNAAMAPATGADGKLAQGMGALMADRTLAADGANYGRGASAARMALQPLVRTATSDGLTLPPG